MDPMFVAVGRARSLPLHAAVAGDTRSVCGVVLERIGDTTWDDVDPEEACARCGNAVVVLRGTR